MGGGSKSKTRSATQTPTNYSNYQGNTAPVKANNISLSAGESLIHSNVHVNNTTNYSITNTDFGAIEAAGEVALRSIESNENTSRDALNLAVQFAMDSNKKAYDFASQVEDESEDKIQNLTKWGLAAAVALVGIPVLAKRL